MRGPAQRTWGPGDLRSALLNWFDFGRLSLVTEAAGNEGAYLTEVGVAAEPHAPKAAGRPGHLA